VRAVTPDSFTVWPSFASDKSPKSDSGTCSNYEAGPITFTNTNGSASRSTPR
jgi:hypothetical protein